MCDFSKGFKLCSCGNEPIRFREQEFYRKVKGELVRIQNKKNKEIPLIYIWRLSRFIEKYKDSTLIGRYILPSDDIGKGLNAEWILLNLNIENCFDFDYIPNEGDNLKISSNEYYSPYISFIFKNNEWVLDHYDPFEEEIKDFAQGLVKNNENQIL